MEFPKDISKATVLVVGDVMLDRYWWGSVSRISPEAPVPVVRLKSSSLSAGGAANVAANIAGLGARPILVGSVGSDAESGLIRDLLAGCGVSSENLIEIVNRPTTVKTRIIAHSQQVARVDQEVDELLNDEQSRRVVQVIGELVTLADSIVISDYAKGFLTDLVLSEILKAARDAGKNVLVDPKGKDYSKYRGATLLTPNRREAADACGLDEDGQAVVDIAGERLMSDHDFGAVLITQGEEGMTLFRRDGQPVHLDAMARSVFDVTGAGDTVIATLAASVGAGTDLETAARLANIAAGLVVEQVGTTAIRADDLRKALDGG